MIRALALATGAAFALSTSAVAAVPHRTVHKVVSKKVVAADGKAETSSSSDPAVKAIVAGCGGQRFETEAEVDDGAGHKRVTRIKLCAKPGEDQAAWLVTLRQARSQVGHLTQLSSASRTKLAAEFDAEIARVGGGNPGPQLVPVPAPADPALIAGPPK